jgi:hypothetical protein
VSQMPVWFFGSLVAIFLFLIACCCCSFLIARILRRRRLKRLSHAKMNSSIGSNAVDSGENALAEYKE